jgi:hypothetical protein
VTKANLGGARLFDIMWVLVGRSGGVYNPLESIALLIVGFFTKSRFISSVMNDIFLVRKFNKSVEDETAKSLNSSNYEKLKQNMSDEKISEEDIDSLIGTI